MRKDVMVLLVSVFIIINAVIIMAAVTDVNNDGVTDRKDISDLAPYYRGVYNSDFDVNSDGVVDLFDIVIIAKNVSISTTSCGSTGTGATITSLSRDVGIANGGTKLTLQGTGFQNTDCIKFGTTSAQSVTFISSTELQVTTPTHSLGKVSVSVEQNGNVDTIFPGFEFMPAPTVTYVTHDFEDGTLGEFTTDWAAPIVGEWGADISVSGTYAVRAKKWNGSDGASKLVHSRSGKFPTNPPLSSTGVYQRWYQMMPQDSLDAAATGQIKFLLNRGGPDAWLMGIIGAQAGSGSGFLDEVVMLQDANTGILPPSTGFVVKADHTSSFSASRTGFRIQPDEWVEFQTWFYHNGTHGRVRLWINGKEMFDVLGGTGTRNGGEPCINAASPVGCLGTNDTTGVYKWETGIAWVQANTANVDAIVYVDDAAMANGYIAPI